MFYLLKNLLLLIIVIFKLKCNNLIFNKIMILNASYVCLHAFSLRRESPNPDPGRWTPHFWGGSVTEIDRMKSVLYASVVGSLTYAQVCTRSNIAFAIGMFDRFQKNPGPDHWKGIKKDLWYLQDTKGLMLTYRRSDTLEIVGYTDSDFTGCEDTEKSTLGYVFLLAEEPYRGKASSKLLPHHLRCMRSL
jgi:hypothetical protein